MATSYRSEADGPDALARRMSTYKSDARYIRAMVCREYGRSPTIPEIEDMIAGYKRLVEAFASERKADNSYIAENDNGDPFKPRCLIPLAQRPRPPRKPKPTVRFAMPVARAEPWPSWYVPPHTGAFLAGDLVKATAAVCGLTYNDLVGKGRSREFTHARAIVIRILRNRGWSYPRIGKQLGDRDHTTIMHSYESWAVYVRLDPSVAEIHDKLIEAGWGKF